MRMRVENEDGRRKRGWEKKTRMREENADERKKWG